MDVDFSLPSLGVQLSAPKEEDLVSLVSMLLPVAERKGLSAGSKAERIFPLAIPTVPFS